MTKAEAKVRIAKLKEQIKEYSYQYHVLDKPTVDDAVWDSLKHELNKIEQQYPDLITPDSPSQRVSGEVLKKFKAARHLRPMLSLNDVFSPDELEAWIARIQKMLPESKPEFHIDLKLDGLAMALVYENGQLARALTRGDGIRGEDVTHNVRTIPTVPLSLNRDKSVPAKVYQGTTEVRGEVLIYKSDFAKLNKQREAAGQPLYANPRNTAAGSIRQLDPKLTASRPLRFHAWRLYCDPQPNTLFDEYELAAKIGFIINPEHAIVSSTKAILEVADVWETKREKLSYQIDGLVVRVNNNDKFEQLGVVGKAPRGAIAYKYAAEQASTKIKDIQISIGRTGAATPFAVMEPVKIAGSTVQMATLHNEGEIARKDIRIGDTVVVQKAGDIIPEVVEPLVKLRTGKEKKYIMPTHCPVCETKLVKGKEEEAIWRCPNKLCPARVRGQLAHFASKDALDIEGLGEQNVATFLKEGLISDVGDLFRLKKEQIADLERFGEKSAENIVNAIQEKKQVPLDRFIFGLGIRHIGRQTAIDLATHFGSVESMLKATVEDFEAVPGIGAVVAHSVYIWLNEPRNQQLLKRLQESGVTPKRLQTGGKLNGKSFAITGTLKKISRDEAADKIRALGGKFQSSVGKDTDYLVVGESPGGSKITNAKKYDTTQITEAELQKLL